MKIKHLPIAVAALMLCACGGSNQNSGSQNTDTVALPDYIAHAICKQINPKETPDTATASDNNKLFYGFSYPDPEDPQFGEYFIQVQCFPKSNGEYVAVYILTNDWDAGDYSESKVEAFKSYLYKNGTLTEDNNLLPKPSFDDFNNAEGLWFYNPNDPKCDSARTAFNKKGCEYRFNEDMIDACISNEDKYFRLHYKWNGSEFKPSGDGLFFGCISSKGLANIRFGEVPPQKLAGFDINTMGRTMYFNRNAKRDIKLSLSSEGKVDTIEVFSEHYGYQFYCAGTGFLMVGSNEVSDEFSNCLNPELGFVEFSEYDGDIYRLLNDGCIIEFNSPNGVIKSIKFYKKGNTVGEPETDNESDTQPQFATGDLNGDGIKDSVAFNKGFFVYFGCADGKYNLFKKYKVLPYETDESNSYDYSTNIENGKLIITTRRSGDGGFQDYYYTLKFQNDDFVLLKLIDDGGLDGSSTQIYDFEARTYKGDFNECEGDRYTTTAKLKNLPSPKLSDIVIGDSPYDCIDGYIDESTVKTKTR